MMKGINAARMDPSKAAQFPLPGDILADLQDAFNFYDKEETGYISIAHFRNILHNFGFHRMAKRDIDEDLKRADPQIFSKQSVDFEIVRFVVGYRWAKGGKDMEALECFQLFDKRDRKQINQNEIKTVLSSYLEFPVSEKDIEDFMAECDP